MQQLSLLNLLWGLLFLPAAAAISEPTKEISRNLVCLCGDCNRESLATCVCSFAASRREEIKIALDTGKTPEEIIAGLVETYGSVIMATPPQEGFNLLAWIAPFAILVFGGLILRSVLIGWRRDQRTFAREQVDPRLQGKANTDAYKKQLRCELKNYDLN